MSLDLEAGGLLAGRYRLEEYLGAGGVARAWLCRDERTGDRVVAKRPNYESDNAASVVTESLEREADVLESIDEAGGHPNLMGLVHRATVDGQPIVVVEYVTGEDMYAAVKRRNGFTNAEDVRQIGIDLCHAMSFLHENEVIYRDLKPDNVMLSPDGTPVLIDFNTAKGFVSDPSNDDGGSGTVIPNPIYKPPELNNDPELVGYRQGPWSDVYSVGKVLMFLFSASAPEGDAIDPREFPGTRSVPPYLAEIIRTATEGHKADRYRNATVLARVLENRTDEPPDVASVTHLQDGTDYDVYPGDTVGRRAADGPQPAIALEDPDNYISAVQVRFDADGDGDWVLRDRSLNGTYVRRGEDWYRILSSTGRERLRQKDAATDEELARLDERMRLADGDRIALVHPNYGVWLEFTDG
jgi:protein kinase/serine/threonine-protein kinase